MTEFFWTPANSRLMVHNLATDEVYPFDDQKHLGYAKKLDSIIQDKYPQAHAALCAIYGDADCFAFARANRFLKCNFSLNDNQPDIDEDYNFQLELVPCPLRGECKHGICNPKLTSRLSRRELDIVRLHVEGLNPADIGEKLFISKATVHNHFSNIYNKLGFTGQACPDHLLINYAYKNHLV
jgi:DNA-binding CsgD family transcriptional regulator